MNVLKKSISSPVNYVGNKVKNQRDKNQQKKPKNFSDEKSRGAVNNGIEHKGQKFVTHTDLHHKHSAIQTLHFHQKITIILLGGSC